MNINITKHAVERFHQRFKLVYSPAEFDKRRILSMALQATDIGFCYKMNPGRYNIECIRNGGPIFKLKYGNHIEFRGVIKSDGCHLITTIVRTKDYEL